MYPCHIQSLLLLRKKINWILFQWQILNTKNGLLRCFFWSHRNCCNSNGTVLFLHNIKTTSERMIEAVFVTLAGLFRGYRYAILKCLTSPTSFRSLHFFVECVTSRTPRVPILQQCFFSSIVFQAISIFGLKSFCPVWGLGVFKLFGSNATGMAAGHWSQLPFLQLIPQLHTCSRCPACYCLLSREGES